MVDISDDDMTRTVGAGGKPAAGPKRPKTKRPAPSVVQDRYDVLEELGSGGMGVVYRARDRQLGRDVALKLVFTDDDHDETLAARLMREAQALAQLSHPNVVAVYDVGRAEGGVFVAMELIAGEAGDTWLEKRRPWRDVVRVFCDAARGLAAAHAVGLVHRDFKPANVMLGADGRTRVLDFGLARAAGFGNTTSISDSADSGDLEADERSTKRLGEDAEPAASTSMRSVSLLDIALTREGAVVGTPQYMAPEQFRGDPYDARTDQFAFCVAMYKGLYGRRPFEGKTFGELKKNVLAGKLRPPPDSDVPGYVRDLVLRGMAMDPAKRWPSMDDIIAVLARDPAARKKRLVLAGVVAVLVGGGAVTTWLVTRRDPGAVCRDGEQDLVGVWDGVRAQAITDAFAATGRSFAADAAAGVKRGLDDYTKKWLAMRSDACEATHVKGTQSAELLDLRMTCLARRLDSVRATVDVLAHADRDTIAHAGELIGQLPPLDACADAETLRAAVKPPVDPKLAARVASAQRSLAKVRALWVAGRYTDAQTQLAPLRTEASTLAWRPLEGEVLLQAARLADSTGVYADSEKLYRDAAVAAEAGRDDETAALARNGLVWITGERLGHYDQATELAREAEAKVERLGRSDLVRADLDQKMSALLVDQGKLAEALERSKRVLAIREKVMAPDDEGIASALGDLGDVEAAMSKWDDAIPYYRRALDIAQRALGPDHPMIGTLRINLASSLRYKGDFAGALAELAKARTITERALGPDHPDVATIAIDTGGAELDSGHPAEALVQFEHARDIWTKALGADHPNVGTAEFRIGEVALAQGHADAAAASFQHALDIWQAKLGADNPTLTSALDGLARARLAQHRKADAITLYRRALPLLVKSVGPNDEQTLELKKTIEQLEHQK
ncbi:MAG: serine/threonine protein kinase [Deltaproteobacteria bacterium]|nr:serine/threonine protein kinase [Deltaproteobacteria bacterium]